MRLAVHLDACSLPKPEGGTATGVTVGRSQDHGVAAITAVPVLDHKGIAPTLVCKIRSDRLAAGCRKHLAAN